MNKCENCKYSLPDWTNPNNPDYYCSNEISENYGYNVENIIRCEEEVSE